MSVVNDLHSLSIHDSVVTCVCMHKGVLDIHRPAVSIKIVHLSAVMQRIRRPAASAPHSTEYSAFTQEEPMCI